MKKRINITVAFAAAAMVFSAGITAMAYGETVGVAHYSGIDTYINNYPIYAYHYNGRQLICAEDLRSYGFDVDWSEEDRALYIGRNSSASEITGGENIKRQVYLANKRAYNIVNTDIRVFMNNYEIEAFSIDGKMMIKLRELEGYGTVEYNGEENRSSVFIEDLPMAEYAPLENDYDSKLTIVLDPGHGKDSGAMSDDEKISAGYDYYNGSWGEWRHWKNGTMGVDCHGEDCNHYGTCFYSMGNGDRDTEPEINMRNALAAKEKLEEMGYNVRLTRYSNNENPSFKNRVACCFPANDLSAEPDAACYVCIHSNAGGGRGSAKIAAEGDYTQAWIDNMYINNSNLLGDYINDRIVNETSLGKYSGGTIEGLGYMILFNKCPVPAGYLEIGFYDSADLSIINSEYESIGTAIAEGINDFMWN